MPFPRASGILLHPTSFPSRFGIGDLGQEAYRFLDFLAESAQQLWQILPLGPTGYGNSPYMCYSAMAGNPMLISLDQLQEDGLLSEADFAHCPEFPEDTVDFDRAIAYKLPLLRKACDRFLNTAPAGEQQAFEEFCDRTSDWLDDYALFVALKQEVYDGTSWHTWPEEVAKRQPAALQHWRHELGNAILFQKYLQFEFFRQWSALKHYANKHHIQIVGDIPIYVAHDSADVWANPQFFCLDEETGEPALMAGVPPDYFSPTGQLWGNPVYDWENLEKDEFRWWIQRFQVVLESVDIIRIDHFRGFQAYWAVPQGEETAENGEWLDAPGDAFFQRLNQQLGQLPIIAEDLGVITPEVEALRDQYAFPGMKILQFAFDSGTGNPYLPFNYHSPNFVVYTGTHDNDTTCGWYGKRSDDDNQKIWDYIGCSMGQGFHWDLIRLALSAIANQAIFPFQDILGLDSEARMNEPGVPEGNWGWRYRTGSISPEASQILAKYTRIYGRAPS
jgi:4-alpha-glucanotransferase